MTFNLKSVQTVAKKAESERAEETVLSLDFASLAALPLPAVQKPTDQSSIPNGVCRAWYGASVSDFLASSAELIIGHLTRNCEFTLLSTQRDAWFAEIDFLQRGLRGLLGSIFLEFNIPRMGRRIDAVVVTGSAVFVIEFKVGETGFDRAALDQVWDYALDLKNFHEASHSVSIVPILVSTEASEATLPPLYMDNDNVYRPIFVNSGQFRVALDSVIAHLGGVALDGERWCRAPYRPTPTIIEAARALYAHHSVEAITVFDAGKENLRITSRRIEEIADSARRESRKVICFVTGVPGAGKTLVGLNIATHRRQEHQPTHAVFLSGNGPLVAVLREALTRDEFERQRSKGTKVRKSKIRESVKAFIQNVHHFRDEALIHSGPPAEHIAIFDEAQRAWNLRQTASFMQRKKKQPGFSQSEPEFLISYMDRHLDWAVIICLVGGGQEINTGEAGIDSWLEAINAKFPHWSMCISSRLTDSEYAAGRALDAIGTRQHTRLEQGLHLAVSRRSFRAENVSAFVKALLDCDKERARDELSQVILRYPIVLTRDLPAAKNWVKQRARGTERYGLMASSKAQRLKPHAIDIRVEIDPVHWFLNHRADPRSSYYLEDAATEFQVQGLELDWTCVTWDADLRFTSSGWSFHDFRGDRWVNVSNADNRRYLRNSYRVLLTRARQGMAIFVPRGDKEDLTRAPGFYDFTFSYLRGLGIPEL